MYYTVSARLAASGQVIGRESKGMRTLTNFVLGTLLAAVLIGPVASAPQDPEMPTGISIAAAGLWHVAQPISVLTTIRSALVRARCFAGRRRVARGFARGAMHRRVAVQDQILRAGREIFKRRFEIKAVRVRSEIQRAP